MLFSIHAAVGFSFVGESPVMYLLHVVHALSKAQPQSAAPPVMYLLHVVHALSKAQPQSAASPVFVSTACNSCTKQSSASVSCTTSGPCLFRLSLIICFHWTVRIP